MRYKYHMDLVSVMTRGQIVIPSRIRRRLGLKQGTRLSVAEVGGRIVLEPVDEMIKGLRGAFKGSPSLPIRLVEERRSEGEDETRKRRPHAT